MEVNIHVLVSTQKIRDRNKEEEEEKICPAIEYPAPQRSGLTLGFLPLEQLDQLVQRRSFGVFFAEFLELAYRITGCNDLP
jgi:hypothetical protein